MKSGKENTLIKNSVMSDDDGDDVFRFAKKSFRKKHKRKQLESDSDDDDDSVQEMPKSSPSLLMQKLEMKHNLDDDDDDSDGDIVVVTSKPKPTINLLLDDDDDDDSDNEYDRRNRMAKAVRETQQNSAVRQARAAKERLRRAQNYRGEDVQVAWTPPSADLLQDLPSRARAGGELSVSIQLPIGPCMLSVTIRKLEPLQKVLDRLQMQHDMLTNRRATLMLKGAELDLTKTPASCNIVGNELLVVKLLESPKKKQKPSLGHKLRVVLRTGAKDETYELHFREPFSVLMEKYKKKNKMRKNKKVVFKFEGDVVGLQQMPMTHDMEDDEIVEVIVK